MSRKIKTLKRFPIEKHLTGLLTTWVILLVQVLIMPITDRKPGFEFMDPVAVVLFIILTLSITGVILWNAYVRMTGDNNVH